MSRRTRRRVGLVSSVLLLIATPFACTDTHINTAQTSTTSTASGSTATSTGSGGTTPTTSRSSSTQTTQAASSTSSTTSTGTPCAPNDPSCHPIQKCGGVTLACGDGIDNDGDGLIDMDDPDCTGPCDNNEGGLFKATGPAAPCKVGCYFGTQASSHDCYWDHACDANEQAPNYYPESNWGAMCAYNPTKPVNPPQKTCAELAATQSTACLNYCKPLTPNGCDCFGCCELPAGTGHFVWLGSTNLQGAHCTMDALNDPTLCQPCTVVPACYNPCGSCSVCIGKSTPDPGCPTNLQCDAGVQPCGLPGEAACPAGEFCKTGCCYPVPLQ